MNGEPCYFCGRAAAGKDHVPPKVFFPEQKDLSPGSPDYRRGLLTVPSCAAHNNAVSGDDQIAAYALLTGRDVNVVALRQWATKVHRAIGRDPALRSRIIRDLKERRAEGGVLGYTVKLEIRAVNRVMERTARGLFFLATGVRWTVPLKVVSDALLAPDLSVPFGQAVAELQEGMRHLGWGDTEGLSVSVVPVPASAGSRPSHGVL